MATALDTMWMRFAACKGKAELFLPTTGGNRTAQKKDVCDGCPARRGCERYAEATGSIGFWAGERRPGWWE